MVMKKMVLALFVLLALVAGLFLIKEIKTKPKQTNLKIAATIFPLTDLARQITADKIEVINILPPGASEHIFELTPKQAIDLASAQIIFKIGHKLDDWLKVEGSQAKIVTVDKGIELIDDNPHYWLSALNAKKIASSIAAEVSQIDPVNADFYNQRLAGLNTRLDNLHKEIVDQLANLARRDLITFHEAWPYYARDYNLTILATFEPFPGKEPTPRYLAKLAEVVKKQNIKVIFSEPQLSGEVLKPFLRDLDLAMLVLDPIGGLPGRESFESLLRYNTAIIKSALSNNNGS